MMFPELKNCDYQKHFSASEVKLSAIERIIISETIVNVEKCVVNHT